MNMSYCDKTKVISSEGFSVMFLSVLVFPVLLVMQPVLGGSIAGPKDAMETLHGVMMHADEEQGESHDAEHSYDRLQAQDKLQVQPENGPNLDFELHRLSHNADDSVVHSEQAGPQSPQKQGPDDPMKDLHGVLMHNDEEQGQSHDSEDQELSKSPAVEEEPCHDCVGKVPHQHGENLQNLLDEMQGEENEEDETENPNAASSNLEDPDSILHVGGHHDKPPADRINPKMKPMFGTFDLDAMLHGGAHDVHDEKKDSDGDDDDKPAAMFGVFDVELILHGGHHVHGEPEPIQLEAFPPSGVLQPEYLVHDDGIAQPHEHGQEDDDDNEARTHDQEDYENWQKRKGQDGEDSAAAYGFSVPFISDFIMDEFEYVKQRYLNFFGVEVKENIDVPQDANTDDETEAEDENEAEEELYGEEDEDENLEEAAFDTEDYEYEEVEEEQEEEEQEEWEEEATEGEPCTDCDGDVPHAHTKQQEIKIKKMNVHDLQSREQASQGKDQNVEESTDEVEENNELGSQQGDHDMREDLSMVGNTGQVGNHDES